MSEIELKETPSLEKFEEALQQVLQADLEQVRAAVHSGQEDRTEGWQQRGEQKRGPKPGPRKKPSPE